MRYHGLSKAPTQFLCWRSTLLCLYPINAHCSYTTPQIALEPSETLQERLHRVLGQTYEHSHKAKGDEIAGHFG